MDHFHYLPKFGTVFLFYSFIFYIDFQLQMETIILYRPKSCRMPVVEIEEKKSPPVEALE